jgi:hypothetical protein
VLVAAVLVLGVGQLVLPGIAASVLRNRLAKSGRVLSVHVSAFPAIELLWHSADRVVVRMATYHSGVARLNSLLAESSNVGTLSASVDVFHSGLLTLHGVTLSKRGSELTGSATVLENDLRSAVPFFQSLRLVTASSNSLTLQGTASVLGVSASVPATIEPQRGRLVVVPDVPLGAIATVTVFSNPHVAVESVGGSQVPGGLRVTARGRLT